MYTHKVSYRKFNNYLGWEVEVSFRTTADMVEAHKIGATKVKGFVKGSLVVEVL